MDITNQSPSVNLKRSSLSDSDNKPNNEGGLSHTSVNQSCWRFPWPQVFQVSSPKTSPKTSKKEGNWLQVFKQDKPSTPQGSSGKIGSSGDSSTLRREESTGEKESNGAREDEISSNAEKAKGGEAEQPLQNGSSSGKAENERKGPRAGLSLHSTVTCLSKEEMDKLAKERMMTLVRGMLAAQNLQGDNVPVEVDKGLFLGSASAARNKSELQQKKITHILTVANSLSPAFPSQFRYKLIEVLDSPEVDLLSRFSQCFEFIEDAKKKRGGVLVHCFAGRSRSVTVVVAFLMKTHGLTVSEALAKVREVRPEACPNFGFLFQLRDYEKSLREEGIIKS